MGTDNASLARRYLTEIWGKGNLAVIDELVDKDIVLRDPIAPEAKGIDTVKERVKMMSKSFTDMSLTIDEIIVSGDRVVIRDTWRGRHIGDFFGISKTGKTMSCAAVEILRIKDGKVVENESVFDVYTMFQQLGVLPPPDKLHESAKQTPQYGTVHGLS